MSLFYTAECKMRITIYAFEFIPLRGEGTSLQRRMKGWGDWMQSNSNQMKWILKKRGENYYLVSLWVLLIGKCSIQESLCLFYLKSKLLIVGAALMINFYYQ